MNECIEYKQGISRAEAPPRSSADVHAHICAVLCLVSLVTLRESLSHRNGPEAHLADG